MTTKDRSLKALGLTTCPPAAPDLSGPAHHRALPADRRRAAPARRTAAAARRVVRGGAPGAATAGRGPRRPRPGGHRQRHPVIAVGSNASPGQVAHKLTRLGIPAAVPMVPVRVRGIGVGCSGHISPAGYVAGTPYVRPGGRDDARGDLAGPDAAQGRRRHRVPRLPAGDTPRRRVQMTMPSGERLGGAYIYFSAHGVLAEPETGRPRAGGGDQSELLAALLAGSERLRDLLGPDPAAWVRRAGCRPVAARGGHADLRRGGLGIAADRLPAVRRRLGRTAAVRRPSAAGRLPAVAGL